MVEEKDQFGRTKEVRAKRLAMWDKFDNDKDFKNNIELLNPDGTWGELVYKDLDFDKDPIIYNAMISDCMEHNYYLQEDKEAQMIHVFRTKK